MSFFPKVQYDIKNIKGNSDLLKHTTPKEYTCKDCGSCSKGSDKAPLPAKIYGEGRKGILVITDALTEELAISNDVIPKLHKELLEKAIGTNNISADLHIVNAIRQVPKTNITVCSKACSKQLRETIKELKPKVIVTLGFRALSTLWADHDVSVTDKWEQWVAIDKDIAIPDQILGCWVVPMFDPRDFIWSLSKRLESVKRWAKKSKEEKGYVSKYHQDVLSSKESIVNIDGLWDDDLKNRWRWFVRDWETVYNHVDKEFPVDNEPLELFGEDDITGAVEAIEYFKTQPMIAVDIEATSLSPYRAESEILCIGFSNLKRNVGIRTKHPIVVTKVKELLSMEKRWLIHNCSYEWTMFREKYDVSLKGTIIDTQILAHCFDHRTGCSGLKPNASRYVGVFGYEQNSAKFFKIRDLDKGTRFEGGNLELNQLGEALERHKIVEKGLLYPIDPKQYPEIPAKEIKAENKRRNTEFKKGSLAEKDLLTYVTKDVIYTSKIFLNISKRLMDNREWEAVLFYSKSSITLAKMSRNGILVDEKALLDGLDEIQKEIDDLHYQIMNSDEAKRWDGEEEFNYNSGAQLGHLLFDIIGYKSTKETKAGKKATDASTLDMLGSPMCKLITKKKQLEKTRVTYLGDLYRNLCPDGYVRPGFSLALVSSFRSSSAAPNFQNIPKNNERMKELIRVCFIAPEGYTLNEADITGSEAYTASIITNCDAYAQYNLYGAGDIHLDVAKKVFGFTTNTLPVIEYKGVTYTPDEGLTKRIRQISKKFTFALSYGATYKSISKDLWDSLGTLPTEADKLYIQALLGKNGISNFAEFELQVKEGTRWFWEDLFTEYGIWNKEIYNEYVSQGYLRNKCGFVYRDIMTPLTCPNYSIQSIAYMKVQNAINILQDKIEELNLESKLIFEIHDSVGMYIKKGEEGIIHKLLYETLIKGHEGNPMFDWVTMDFKAGLDVYVKGNFATKPVEIPITGDVYEENYITA